MSPRSETFLASLRLPPGALPAAEFRCSGLPSWVLLNPLAYMVDVRNETTAGTTTLDGLHIQVSFLIAAPPRLSYCCICCPNRKENPFAWVPKIVCSVEDLALIEIVFTTEIREWFVYAAGGGTPSLHLLRDLRLYSPKNYTTHAYGLLSHDDGGQFVVASPRYTGGQYSLHIFRSRQSDWTKTLLQVDYGLTKKARRIRPTYVIALGDGLLGWVDLWQGILICDVLAVANGTPAAARFIPMPMPMPLPSNQELYLQGHLPRRIRDVTFSHGQIKCVELEQLVRLIPKAAPVVHDPSDSLLLYDSEAPMVPRQEEEDDEYEVLGWRLVNWYRELTWDHWHRGSMVHSDDLGPVSLPRLGGSLPCAIHLPLKNLQTFYPTLCGDDVVYLMFMLDNKWDQTAWIVAVDTKSKSMSKPMPFSADRYFLLDPNHIPCVLTKYLDAKSDAPPQNCNVSSKKRRWLP